MKKCSIKKKYSYFFLVSFEITSFHKNHLIFAVHIIAYRAALYPQRHNKLIRVHKNPLKYIDEFRRMKHIRKQTATKQPSNSKCHSEALIFHAGCVHSDIAVIYQLNFYNTIYSFFFYVI